MTNGFIIEGGGMHACYCVTENCLTTMPESLDIPLLRGILKNCNSINIYRWQKVIINGRSWTLSGSLLSPAFNEILEHILCHGTLNDLLLRIFWESTEFFIKVLVLLIKKIQNQEELSETNKNYIFVVLKSRNWCSNGF